MGLLNRGNTSAVTLRKPLPINDVTFASTIIAQTDTLSASAGAAGTKGTFLIKYAPIASALGDLVGMFGDSSLAITSTALTTEVPFETVMARAGANQNNETVGNPDYKAYLANGEFYVIYETGKVFYSKADASTAVSAVYFYRSGSSSGGTGTSASQTQGTAATNAAAVGNPVQVGGVYNSTAPILDSGDASAIQLDSLGNTQVNQYTKIAGEDLTYDVTKVQRQATYTNISASALIKTGAGQLMGIMVNSCAATATIKIWDNTSAATTVLLNTITFTLAATQGGFFIPLPDIKFTTGLYVTIAVAAMDVTILWN